MGYFDKDGVYHANPNDSSARSDEKTVRKQTGKDKLYPKSRRVLTEEMIEDSSRNTTYTKMDSEGNVMTPMSSVYGTWPSQKDSFLHGIGKCSCNTTGCCPAGWAEQ